MDWPFLLPVRFKLLHPDARPPSYATPGSAGCDIYSLQRHVLAPGDVKEISTGVAVEIPLGYFMRIEDRSGLAIKGIQRLAGVIDSDFRGEVSPILKNVSLSDILIEKYDRIAQGIILPVLRAEFVLARDLSESSRGEGRFSSTGR